MYLRIGGLMPLTWEVAARYVPENMESYWLENETGCLLIRCARDISQNESESLRIEVGYSPWLVNPALGMPLVRVGDYDRIPLYHDPSSTAIDAYGASVDDRLRIWASSLALLRQILGRKGCLEKVIESFDIPVLGRGVDLLVLRRATSPGTSGFRGYAAFRERMTPEEIRVVIAADDVAGARDALMSGPWEGMRPYIRNTSDGVIWAVPVFRPSGPLDMVGDMLGWYERMEYIYGFHLMML